MKRAKERYKLAVRAARIQAEQQEALRLARIKVSAMYLNAKAVGDESMADWLEKEAETIARIMAGLPPS